MTRVPWDGFFDLKKVLNQRMNGDKKHAKENKEIVDLAKKIGERFPAAMQGIQRAEEAASAQTGAKHVSDPKGSHVSWAPMSDESSPEAPKDQDAKRPPPVPKPESIRRKTFGEASKPVNGLF